MNAVVTEAQAAADNKLSSQLAKRGVDDAVWNTLKNSIFPGAMVDSILMAIDYCKARNLDVLKKPCHIVPMNVKDAKTNSFAYRDVILPGIYEYRTTAMRTGLYLGHTEPTYGPEIESDGLKHPEWCEMTMLRWNEKAQREVRFPVRVIFREVVGLTKEGAINARWQKAPVQMLTKCTEAAGLREAFPEELGGEPTMDEMTGVISEGDPVTRQTKTAADHLRAKFGDKEPVVSTQAAAAQTNQSDNSAQQAAKPAEKVPGFTIATAMDLLRAQNTVGDLKAAYDKISDEFEFRAQELPIDIEAFYRDRRESMQQKAKA